MCGVRSVRAGCVLSVRVQYRVSGKNLSSRTTPLGANCRFRMTSSFGATKHIGGRKLTVTARFGGNRFLLPAKSSARSVRAG